MTTTRDDAGPAAPGAVALGERSAVAGIRGLPWWATLLIALVLTVAGVTADVLRSGQLGILYMICFPVGCVLAAVWARRRELFGPMVQPPLLLAVAVPVVVAATGSLPRSGGLVSTALAIGGPLINGFPTMAITTAVCLAVVFIRWKLQPYRSEPDDPPPDAAAGATAGATRPVAGKGQKPAKVPAPPPGPPGPGGRPSGGPSAKGDRGRPPRDDRPRDDRSRDDRPRDDRPRDDRPRDDRGDRPRRPGDPERRAAGVYRVSSTGETERVDRKRPPR